MATTLYTLLGCSPSSNVDQLLAEYRLRILSIHPDKVPSDQKEEMEALFHQLQFAKEVLTGEGMRRHYDLYLAMGGEEVLGMGPKEWMDNREKLQQTFHWVQEKESTPMLSAGTSCKSQVEEEEQANGQESSTATYPRRFDGWTSHQSPLINAFRSYQI